MVRRLLVAILMSMSALASLTAFSQNEHMLQTYRWGYTWKVPQYTDAEGQAVIKRGWTDTIASSNTPGSCDYGSLRATMPVFYAFLDGYDTRAIGTVQDTFPYTSTNCYLRYVIADELKDRYKKLYDLECGDLGERTFWSSTSMESALAALGSRAPTEKNFGWTTEISTNMFADNVLTGWLPAFKGCVRIIGSTVYAWKRYNTSETRRGLFWEYILPKMSFKDPDTYSLLYRSGSDTEACLPEFDDILMSRFGRSNEWNKIEYDINTRRLNTKALAQQSQALSMFDRTIHIDKMPVAYTNKLEIGGSVDYSAKVQFGSVDFHYLGGGEYESSTFDPAHGGAIPTIDGSIGTKTQTTNFYSYAETYAPRVGTTKTYLDYSVTVTVDIPDGVAETYINDMDIQAGLLDIFTKLDSETGEQHSFAQISIHFSEFGGIDFYSDYYDSRGVLHEVHSYMYTLPWDVPDIPDGQYDVSGQALMHGWYRANATALPRLPYRYEEEQYEIYPDATVFRPTAEEYPYKKLHFMSFARVNDYKDFWNGVQEDIDFQGGEGYDWNNMTNYGYKCIIDKYQWYAQGDYSIPLILLEMLCQIDAKIYNPIEWSGLSQQDFRAWLSEGNTDYSIHDEVKFHNDETGQLGSHIVDAVREGNVVKLYDQSSVRIQELRVGKRFLNMLVTYPLNEGVTYRKTPSSTLTRLNTATEAIWGFPEVTTALVGAPEVIDTKTGWYYVKFDPNSTTASVSPSKKFVWVGETYGELPVPQNTDESKNFFGWYTDSIGGFPVLSTTIVPECGTSILYAHWEDAALVTYDPNGGVVVPRQEYCHGTVKLPKPSRAGYVFLGWYYEGGGRVGGAGDEFSCSVDTTLMAHWEERE